MFNQIFSSKRRIFIVTSVVIFLLICIFSIIITLSRQGKLPVVFSIVPSSARITLENNTIGSGTQYLTAGSYKIKVEQPGFDSQEKTIVVTDKKKQNVVAVSLTPQSDDAKKWAEKNQKAYKDNETFGGLEAQENGQYFRSRFPIIEKLPYTDPYYKIAYRTNGDDIIITIDTDSPRYRYFAVQKIRELGFNPTDYTIDFKQFKNPLEVTHE
ncbi:PEGA domain-containing protein [Candidatus Saccharibacteria bacterium]|nr:PEGA domain-containing protein [Candidatus Saccharibacteria bacterium]MBH1973218.1 PEGA domain-containing protein [Candidatus Saccharibacteria bacterium]MBH1990541.1 PEGA domain-containing protein [Candidatus Saccharibacteria bacterium]